MTHHSPTTLSTVEETREFGRVLGTRLVAGDLVVLTGPLGAGKTVLAQGIGAGLGVAGAVTSPTFVIARVHRADPSAGGTVPMVHVDAYRLGTVTDPRAEVDDLDLDASVQDAVTVVEWGEGVVEQLADAHLQVCLTRPDGDPSSGAGDPAEERTVALVGYGGDWVSRLAALRLPVECSSAGTGD